MNHDKLEKPIPLLLITASLSGLFVLAGLFYLFYGRVFLDAGFYLNSAREVVSGKMPYRDFFFVQGPVYPYVYGFILRFFSFTVVSARSLSLVFGTCSILLAALTAQKLGNHRSAIIALSALATVPYQAYFFSSVKLYALTGFLIMLAFAVFASNLKPTLRYSLGMVCVVLAASTRLTLVPVAFIAAIYIMIDSYKENRKLPWIALLVSIGTATALAAPFLLTDHQAMLYNLIGIHTSAAEGPNLFPFSKQIIVLIKLLIFYPVLTLTAAYLLVHLIKTKSFKSVTLLEFTMLISIGCVTVIHLTANWFSMGYQSPIMPLTAAVLGGLAGRLGNGKVFARPILITLLVVITLTWFVSWKKPVWRNDLTVTRSLSFIRQALRQHCPTDGTVAGCNGIFALEAQRPHALAFGGAPFTYTPRWNTEKCNRFGGMNNAMIISAIKEQSVAAFLLEDNSFSVGFPGFFPVDESIQNEIYESLNSYYRPVGKMRSIGSGELDLILYTPAGNSQHGQ